MEAQGCWKYFSSSKILLFVLFALYNLVCSIAGDEQLLIIHKPDYLIFRENSSLRASEIPEVLSSIFGFTTINDDKWPGVESGNPLKRPEAIVVVEIEGLDDAQIKTPALRFPLQTDVEPGWPFQLIADRTYIRFAEEKPVLMSIANDDSLYTLQSEYPTILDSLPVKPNELKSKVLGRLELKALNESLVPDMKFLMDAQILAEISRIVKVKSDLLNNGIPDIFWFRLTGIQELVSRFARVYNSNALIAALAVDYQTGNSIRAGRSLLQITTSKPPVVNDHNVAAGYDESYSAIFNIVLFVMLVFWLSIFAISIGIWHMDPGRDSIIYRMTSQRMKKDQ
uniref:Renin receptor n=1 Tax=Strigamia maritima TaxID=126957 RepID=T1J457_STRMM